MGSEIYYLKVVIGIVLVLFVPLHCQSTTKGIDNVKQYGSKNHESGAPGRSKYENEYVCSMLGNLAGCRFYEGDVVAATLRFSTHEYQGQVFQEILATDIVKLGK